MCVCEGAGSKGSQLGFPTVFGESAYCDIPQMDPSLGCEYLPTTGSAQQGLSDGWVFVVCHAGLEIGSWKSEGAMQVVGGSSMCKAELVGYVRKKSLLNSKSLKAARVWLGPKDKRRFLWAAIAGVVTEPLVQVCVCVCVYHMGYLHTNPKVPRKFTESRTPSARRFLPSTEGTFKIGVPSLNSRGEV